MICKTHHTLVSAMCQSLQVFGSRLYRQLKDEPGNIIMSPFSVSGVMAMVGLLSCFLAPQHMSLRPAVGGCWGWWRYTVSGATGYVIPKVGTPLKRSFFNSSNLKHHSSEELALGYKDAIPALRTNENFTLEAANSIFAQVQYQENRIESLQLI